jgi:hypothetical protein
VEVLTGLKSTAFGSSSIGGVVHAVPQAPKHDRYEGKVSAVIPRLPIPAARTTNLKAPVTCRLSREAGGARNSPRSFSDSGYFRSRAASDTDFRFGYEF